VKIGWIKLVVGAVAAEIGAILILVCLVAIFGPKEANAAQAYAEKLGRWVGPLAGAALSFSGALWVGRTLAGGRLFHGVLFGSFMALIDTLLLVAMQPPFEWIFVASNAGKVFAATLGGLVSARLRGGRIGSQPLV
jgi:hypothetical protein